MTFNVKLAKDVRELIRLYPERHDQHAWSTNSNSNPKDDCGTKACLAGWTAAACGYTVRQVEEGEAGIPGGYSEIYVAIDYWAREKLGLDEEQMYDLFYCYDKEVALERFDELIAKAERDAINSA